jgi:two-component system cell cycle response regulator
MPLSIFDDATHDNTFDQALEEKLSLQNAVVIVLEGADIGKRFVLKDGTTIIGRNPDHTDILISDRTVSAIHSRIDYDPVTGGYSITDLESKNGTLVNSQETEATPLHDGDKIFIGATILKFTFEDTFEDRFYSKLHELMNVDRLTGLPVKRIFDEELEKAFGTARRNGETLSLLMMDLDGLKQINDTFGHQMGSQSIAETGKIVGEEIGGEGMASRFGGDEFIAFLPGMPLEKAKSLGEHIREKIADHTIRLNGDAISSTISIGIAERTHAVATPEELIRLADEALYRAKKAGRNALSD